MSILERSGLSAGRRGIILDVTGNEIAYHFDEMRGPRISETLWDEYQTRLIAARYIVERSALRLGALAGACKLCHWYSACSAKLRQSDDLTLIRHLGRSIRDAMHDDISTVADLATIDPDAKPMLTAVIALPTSDVELFFGIEVDPMRDLT